MRTTFGTSSELYGWDRALAPIGQVVICEGEFDRLALESPGFAAVTSTAGALTFRKEWADALRSIPDIYVCFDRDGAGEAGARRVAAFLPAAKIVTLPRRVAHGGDVSDFFIGLGRTIEEFDAPLATAQRMPGFERLGMGRAAHSRRAVPQRGAEAADLKSQVQIEIWISADLELEVRGRNFAALCPFHDDKNPSLVVFPQTQTFHCFGCNISGDVFTYLMLSRRVTFVEAVRQVQRPLMEHGEEAA
ncbi:MAG: CHC2 zinc finger domain-containing protein [Terriglobales bacterium]